MSVLIPIATFVVFFAIGFFITHKREQRREHRTAARDRDNPDEGTFPLTFAPGGAIYSGVPLTTSGVTITTAIAPYKTEKPDASLKESTSEIPILAYKVARLSWLPNRGPLFSPLNQMTYYGSRITYGVEEKAICLSDPRIYITMNRSEMPPHGDCPSLSCQCGFYACTDLSMLNGGAVVLEVELSGRVIVCERGYRAGHQRVIRAHLRGCHYCGVAPSVASFEAESELRLRCSQHTDTTPSVPIADLTALLGVPVDVDSSVRSLAAS